MGNPANQPLQPTMAVAGTAVVHQQQSSTSIIHFSHPHHLFLSQQSFNAHCSGCKQNDASSGAIYTCTSCNYSLHQKCSQMPPKITHPFDKNNHVLSLMTKPAYPDGTFTCDACGELGYGFNYSCESCGIDLHVICASSPMVITRQFHQHQLNLMFSPPYPNGTFSCDVCRLDGSKNWLYRCHICEFDVHLTCVKRVPPSNPPLIHHQQSLPNYPSQNNPLAHQQSLPNHQVHPSQNNPLAHQQSFPNHQIHPSQNNPPVHQQSLPNHQVHSQNNPLTHQQTFPNHGVYPSQNNTLAHQQSFPNHQVRASQNNYLVHQQSFPNYQVRPSQNNPLPHQQSFPNYQIRPLQNNLQAQQQPFPDNQVHPSVLTVNSAPPQQGIPIMANNFTRPVMAPANYNPFPVAAGGFQQFQAPPRIAAPVRTTYVASPAPAPAGPYAAPTPLAGSLPIMDNGGYGAPMTPASYGQPQNTLGTQMGCSVANGIASGVSQEGAQEMMQGMFDGGGDGGNGGGGNDMNSLNTGADVVSVDQSYSDGSFSQADGGDQGYSDGSFSQVDGGNAETGDQGYSDGSFSQAVGGDQGYSDGSFNQADGGYTVAGDQGYSDGSFNQEDGGYAVAGDQGYSDGNFNQADGGYAVAGDQGYSDGSFSQADGGS